MSDEIKSTMERVMERLAAMDAAAGGEDADAASREADEREGMRKAAAYMRDELDSLTACLSGEPQSVTAIRRGMVQTLLRNIFLPREEAQLLPAEKAMQGLVELLSDDPSGSASKEWLGFLAELKKLLKQYLAHREHFKKQLSEQFAQQMEMLESKLASQTGVSVKLSPEQHPKFQEEWKRVEEELDGQYKQAIEQVKQQLGEHFGLEKR